MNGLVFILISLYSIFVLANDEDTKKQEQHKWAYDGDHGLFDPGHWMEVSRYCNNAIYMQSPINIDTTKLSRNELMCDPLHQLDIHFVNNNKGIINGLAKNNGHSLVITPVQVYPEKHGFIKLNQEHNCIMELSNFWNYNHNIPNNKYYCFDSFHFHWGRSNDGKGSEHQINGKQYPLEAHFVHYSCDYNNIAEALSQWRLGGDIGVLGKRNVFVLGVIGVFFEIGEANPILNKVFEQYDKLEKVNSEQLIEGIDLNEILPPKGDRGYYTYDGSLTTPPCFPVVKWHIMKQVLTVSEEQMNNLRKLLNPEGIPEGDNYRPIETNPNPVYDCGY